MSAKLLIPLKAESTITPQQVTKNFLFSFLLFFPIFDLLQVIVGWEVGGVTE